MAKDIKGKDYDLASMQKIMLNNIREQSIVEFNTENQAIFGANVNLKRHINEIRDSLKPVLRRLLIAMYDLKLFPKNPYSKCASIIGETMKKYHPHGDQSTYKSLVYMGQKWRNNITLVETDANFGSAYDSDSFAAHRYTTARLSDFAYDCFFSEWKPANPEADMTVDWASTYDEKNLEPIYLPAKYPLFLINWHNSMGVGRYTCTPGFNPKDAFQAIINLIEDPDADFDMYPECPNGTTLINKKDLKGFLDNKETKIKMRSTYRIEEDKGKTYIIIENVPFEVSPSTIEESVKKLYDKGELPEINDIDHDSVFPGDKFIIMIEVKKGYDPHSVMVKLYRRTELEKTFSIKYAFVNDLESVDHTPRIAMLEWIRYRRQTIKRMKKIQLLEALKRMHFLEILIKIMKSNQIEEFIKIVRTSNNKDIAIKKIMDLFNLTDYQAEKVVDVKISQLSKDKYEEYCEEYSELEKTSEGLMKIIKKNKRIDEIIIKQMEEGIEKYGFKSRTKVTQLIDSIKIPDTEHYLVFSNKYIKKLPYAEGGYKVGRLDNGEKVRKVLFMNNRKIVAIFTEDGRILPIEVNNIGNSSAQSVGISLAQIDCDDNFVDAFEVDPLYNGYIVTVSKEGMISKTKFDEIIDRKNKSFGFMKMGKDDKLTGVCLCGDKDDIIVYTSNGKAVIFPFNDFETTSRNTKGVQAIKLEDGDRVIGVEAIGMDKTLLVTTTDRGYMKRFPIKTMPVTKRNDKGIEINYGNGSLVKVKAINDTVEIMHAYTNDGAFEFDPIQIKAKSRIGKNERVIELGTSSSYVFDLV